MPDQKRTMNDMVVTKKPVVKKQVLPVPQKIIREIPKREEVFEEETPYLDEIEQPVKNKTGCLMWCIVVVCIMALVLGVGGLFTYAGISVTPKQFPGTVDVTVNLSQNNDQNTIFFGAATKTFTNEKIVPSIGQALSEVKATGMIKFYNNNTIAKTIPTKTEIVSSAGKKYTLDKAVTIPAKSATNPGQTDGAVTAVIAGGEGNSRLDDFTFSKPSKTLTGITMHSVGEITGGANSSDSVGDPQAIAATTELLKQEFASTKNLVARLSEQIPDSMIPVPLVLPESPISITIDPKHEDGVRVIASRKVTILMVNRSDIARVLGDDLNISKDVKLTLKEFGSVAAMTSGIAAGQPIPEKLQIRMTGDATIIGSVDIQEIKKKILGVSRKEAKTYLNQVSEIDSYKIRMRPFWRRVIPMNPDDVEVVEK